MNTHWSIYAVKSTDEGKTWCAEKMMSMDGKKYYPTYIKEYFYSEEEAELYAEMHQ